MKPLSAIQLTALAVLIRIGPCYSQDDDEPKPKPQQKDPFSEMYANVQTDYDQNYYGGNNYGAAVDYGNYYSNTDTDSDQPPITCYTCYYKQSDPPQGNKNCDNPFVTDDVPQIICSGPCGKTYQRVNLEGEYTITRHCIKNCHEYSREDGYMQCCTTDLCNSSRPTFTTSHWITTVTCALLTVMASRLLR